MALALEVAKAKACTTPKVVALTLALGAVALALALEVVALLTSLVLARDICDN